MRRKRQPYVYSRLVGGTHSDAIAHTVCVRDAYADSICLGDSDAFALCNADTNSHTDSNADANSHTYALSNTDSDTYAHSDAHSNSYAESDTNSDRRFCGDHSMKRNTINNSVQIARSLALILLVAAPTSLWLSGCAGSGGVLRSQSGSASTKSTKSGRAAFTFNWPKRAATSKLIPVDANSIRINVNQNGATVATQTIARPTTGATSATVTFDNLPVGTYQVIAVAFPNADTTGTAQAQAVTNVTIVPDLIEPISLTLSSTITTLTVTPPTTSASPTVAVGKTTTLSATPTDAAGSVVLTTPSTLQWSSSAPGVASVDSNGNVTGIHTGSTTITVTETESGKSASLSLTVVAAPPVTVSTEAVAYQINPGHSGSTSFGQTLSFPSSPTWSVNLGFDVSYPLIAGGKVFVTIGDNSGGQGTQLYALDEATGKVAWGPIALGGYYHVAGLTYDAGMVFAVNGDGLLQAFDAATGTPGWAISLPGQYSFSAPPTAANGIVYVGGAGSGGTLYAVNESTGGLIWKESVENGDTSSPTLSFDSTGASTGVYVSYPCQDYDFNPTTGSSLWHYAGPCEGGGGKTAAYANGLLYVRDSGGEIFDATSGTLKGAFNSGPIPALGTTTGFFLSGTTLTGTNLASRQGIWTFSGDGHLVTAPIAVDQTVFVGSASGTVYAVDAATGTQLWSGSAGAAINAPDEQNVSQPLTGLGAGEGYLVVPAGSTLTAWRIVGQ